MKRIDLSVSELRGVCETEFKQPSLCVVLPALFSMIIHQFTLTTPIPIHIPIPIPKAELVNSPQSLSCTLMKRFYYVDIPKKSGKLQAK